MESIGGRGDLDESLAHWDGLDHGQNLSRVPSATGGGVCKCRDDSIFFLTPFGVPMRTQFIAKYKTHLAAGPF